MSPSTKLSDNDDFDVEEARDLQTSLDWATHEFPDFLHLAKRLPPRRDDEPDALGDLRDMLDGLGTAWGEVVDRLEEASRKAEELVAEMEDADDA